MTFLSLPLYNIFHVITLEETSYLAVVIDAVLFVILTSYSFDTRVMLILILINV